MLVSFGALLCWGEWLGIGNAANSNVPVPLYIP
jgi:hypothetical protein